METRTGSIEGYGIIVVDQASDKYSNGACNDSQSRTMRQKYALR
jgi:hypothetical protein